MPWNHRYWPQLGLSHIAVSSHIPPISAPSVEVPSHKSALLSTDIGHVYNFTGHLPAVPFPLMKENIPPSKPTLPLFEPPAYDSFFSALREPVNSSPTSYDGLWNSPLFQSNTHAILSPLGFSPSLDTLHSFDSSGQPSTSSTTTTPSFCHSSTLFSD